MVLCVILMLLYYIVSLHQTTTACIFIPALNSCIISFLYIKPQLLFKFYCMFVCCIISFLYIKPQQSSSYGIAGDGCIISFLYIKPQLNCHCSLFRWVVLYRFSTSNHNRWRATTTPTTVVLYRFSTSNHNQREMWEKQVALYYIVSLHQTTTMGCFNRSLLSCIISFLYIKPQLITPNLIPIKVVLYRFSTSNHNAMQYDCQRVDVVLYRFSTSNHNCGRIVCNGLCVVLYRFSTSNHNTLIAKVYKGVVVLYRFSTSNHNSFVLFVFFGKLYYIVSLHQTTTMNRIEVIFFCCIISFLYIKPQLSACSL